MKEALQLIVVLTIICLVAGLALASVYGLTKARIDEAGYQEMLDALEQVLPPHDNNPGQNQSVIINDEKDWIFYIARKDGAFAGTAFETSSSEGYGGEIRIMIGINAADSIEAIVILDQTETPGLGAKIEGIKFTSQFSGRNALDTDWCSVEKDGGSIDSVTGATISSRAVAKAVREGLEAYLKYADKIQSHGE